MSGSAGCTKAFKECIFAFNELMLQRHNVVKQRVTEIRFQDSEFGNAGKGLTIGSWG